MRCHLRTSLQSLIQSDETKLKASAKMFHNHDATVVVNLLKVLGQKRRYTIPGSLFAVHLIRSRAHLKQVSSPKPHQSTIAYFTSLTIKVISKPGTISL